MFLSFFLYCRVHFLLCLKLIQRVSKSIKNQILFTANPPRRIDMVCRHRIVSAYLQFSVKKVHQPKKICPEFERALESRKDFREFSLQYYKLLCSRRGNILKLCYNL